jgi:hypothetical protein
MSASLNWKERFRAALEAGMRLHVLAYDVNARKLREPSLERHHVLREPRRLSTGLNG